MPANGLSPLVTGSPCPLLTRRQMLQRMCAGFGMVGLAGLLGPESLLDRKSTRLNSSHSQISYAAFCLKKKKRHFGDPTLVGLTATRRLLLHTLWCTQYS